MTSASRPQVPSGRWEPLPQRRQLLPLILALTLVRGLLYLAVFPPWQHYDEPTHFEYVRLIAARGRLPQPGDYDLGMRQEIASSMQAAGFWKDLGTPTIDFWSDQPPWIGASELYHPPLYYGLLAGPQLLVAHQSVETQLYLARLGSILLNLVVVAAAYGLARELFPRRQGWPAAVATFVALLPPFTDLMSAVNNDAGAAAATSLLLWAGVRLVRRGPSPGRVIGLLLLTGVCIATKSTAGAVAVAALLTIVAVYVRQWNSRWFWRGLALLIPAVLVTAFTWGRHAAHWYSFEQPASANRAAIETPLDRSAFALSSDGRRHPRIIVQELSRTAGQSLRGHTVTVGAWLQAADSSDGTVIFSLDDGHDKQRFQAEATSDWQFHAFTATVRSNAPTVALYATLAKSEDTARTVYLDGVVLVDGEMAGSGPPRFETGAAMTGHWGWQLFTNLIRNGSAERAWPGLRTWIGNLTIYRQPLSSLLHSLWDWPRTAWVYGRECSILLRSFWGTFGWGHLRLPVAYSYPLGFLTAMGIVGSGFGLVRRIRSGRGSEPWQRRAWGLLGLACLVGWGNAVLRIHPVFLVVQRLFWPVARYASVAVVPTATFLCLGLTEIVPRRWLKGTAWLGLLALIALDAVALWTVVLPYYYG